jgi:hypothetical protein
MLILRTNDRQNLLPLRTHEPAKINLKNRVAETNVVGMRVKIKNRAWTNDALPRLGHLIGTVRRDRSVRPGDVHPNLSNDLTVKFSESVAINTGVFYQTVLLGSGLGVVKFQVLITLMTLNTNRYSFR